MTEPRCVLFFPGSRPELLSKALASGAGLVCLDLEDAVPAEKKDEVRRSTMGLLASEEVAVPQSSSKMAVRINHPSTDAGAADVAALEGLTGPLSLTVMVPKARSASELDTLHRRLATDGRTVSVIAVVETAAGL
ncbi:MAG: aldolase/citrate lyase family protein, partial [Longimicrobiales bacterium]|nr:aldolase/citrate lyase family protein [Longimicrobiales bacterium]